MAVDLFVENQHTGRRLPIFMETDAAQFNDCGMFKIILAQRGSVLLDIDKKPLILSAPALLCCNEKETPHTRKSDDLHLRTLYFNPSIVNPAINLQNVYDDASLLPDAAKLDHFYFAPFIERAEGRRCMPAQVEIGPVTAKKLSDAFDALQQQLSQYSDNLWPCRNRSFLIEILFLIHHCYTQNGRTEASISGTGETGTLISEILLHLHLNYNRKITIEDLTHTFNTNRNTLNKRFRQETGMSVFDYIIRLRIKVACMLLRDTSLPITEIMDRVGFSDVSYWGRAFKKNVGLTPSDYRKQKHLSKDQQEAIQA